LQIISGKYARRKLLTPKGREITRPPLSRFTKAVFDTLRPFLERGPYLDAFGGTGSFAIEALSRGAPEATILEMDRKTSIMIQKNIDKIGVEEPVNIYCVDTFSFLPKLAEKEKTFGIIGLAPPYHQGFEAKILLLADHHASLLQEDGLVFLQHPRKEKIPEKLAHLHFWKARHYGKTTFSYFLKNPLD